MRTVVPTFAMTVNATGLPPALGMLLVTRSIQDRRAEEYSDLAPNTSHTGPHCIRPSITAGRSHRPVSRLLPHRLWGTPLCDQNPPLRLPRTVASAVTFDNVSFAFDEHVVLDRVSFSVPKGSMRILLGASGAGKSVVLKLILGLLRPDSGAILLNGQRIDVMNEGDLMRLRADIGMLFQDNALFDSLTVAENVGYWLFEETDMPDTQARGRVEEVLGFVGLGEFADRLPSELSGGQRRRVAIARAMAAKPSLLLFDDPTSGLDPIIATTVTTRSSSCATSSTPPPSS